MSEGTVFPGHLLKSAGAGKTLVGPGRGKNWAGRRGMEVRRLWYGVDLVAMVRARSYPPFLQPPNSLLSPPELVQI